MNLIIDIGNTLTKVYIADKGEIVHNEQFSTDNEIPTNKIFSTFPLIKDLIISTVVEKRDIIKNDVLKKLNNIIFLKASTPLPIKNLYQTPETLGKDRIAAVVGAHNIFPGENVLAIDTGTAITYDFINSKDEYYGGNISPGMSMRYKALNKFTSKLPLLSSAEKHPFLGTNTPEAIIAGVQNGIVFEIDAYINKLKGMHKNLKVILTGGDSFFFAGKLKNPIFAESFLVALGLNRILEYNVKKI